MKYHKKVIKDFVMHLAGELKARQLELEGKAAGANLLHGLQKFRAHYGTSLLPTARIDGTQGEGDTPPDAAARKATAQELSGRIKQVLAMLDVIKELTFSDDAQPESM